MLRFASLLIVAAWIGGLAVLTGLGAPTIFTVLEGHDVEAGRPLAAMLFGVIFRRFQYLAWILGGLLLALLGTRAALGPRPRQLGVRVWIAASMLAMSLAGGLLIAPRIDAAREATSGPIANLPDGDARTIEVARLHAVSNALVFLTLCGGVCLLWMEMKDAH